MSLSETDLVGTQIDDDTTSIDQVDPASLIVPDRPENETPVDLAERPVYQFPPSAYYDPAWYEHEQRELFGKTWNLVGHEHDLPEPGDFIAVTVGTEPVVVVRTPDGELRGFVNMCRHRGMTIVQSDNADRTGNCGDSLRCPYHGWEWDLAGDLTRVPQRKTQFPDMDVADYPLFDVAIGTWRGFIFVHPDADEQDNFTEWLADFDDASGEYPWEQFVEVYRIRWDLTCNWKLYIENHIDWLHLWYLHSGSLNMYNHHAGIIRDCGLHWASSETVRPGRERDLSDGLLAAPGVSEEEQRTLRANLLFPNVPFVTTGRSLQSYQIVPTGPETCYIDLRIFAMPGSKLSEAGEAGAKLVLYDEDALACEQMQAAVHSPRFVVGPLAVDLEQPIADLHERLIRYLGDPMTSPVLGLGPSETAVGITSSEATTTTPTASL